jgi:hypothetical protein
VDKTKIKECTSKRNATIKKEFYSNKNVSTGTEKEENIREYRKYEKKENK